jgi:SAM-dependent methyltransferase/uncharacterized protein YbaR (Trm112 family)
VRRGHFETLQPVCPVCRPDPSTGFKLNLAQVASEADGHVIEGTLLCPNTNCLREFPIIDGIPLLLSNIRAYIAENILPLCARTDLSEFSESILGDCCGPGSAYEVTRQHLSSYTWDHYGDQDPAELAAAVSPGSMRRTLESGLEFVHAIPPGPLIDIGCSVGRGTFELAARFDRMVLGIDLHYAMLRLAGTVLREGRVRYARRRTGLVYDRREFPANQTHAKNVDFWACDAAALPFMPGSFAMATAMNVLDCIHAPHALLTSLGQVLKPGGSAVLCCPYDWAAGATPVEAWLGGHSQRSPLQGDSAAVLRTLLTPGARADSIGTLQLAAERDDLPWHVRLHDRSTMTYQSHLAVARRVG